VQQPFKVGDEANLSGYEGVVRKIGLRTTEVKLRNGLIAFLPNADVLAKPIINYTRASSFRVELPVGVSYDADLEEVRGFILDAVRTVPGYVESPAAQVLSHTFGVSSVDLIVQFWISNTADQHVAKDMALTKIKQAFANGNIEVPYPVQIVRTQARKATQQKTNKTK
jgi:small-conductance mechanosensitive channel